MCVDEWQLSTDKQKVVAVAFLDMANVFDRVPRQRLLEVLFECGLGGTALQCSGAICQNAGK